MFQTRCRENQNSHFVFNNILFFENGTVFEIVWKKYIKAVQATDDNIIRPMPIAYWTCNATDTLRMCNSCLGDTILYEFWLAYQFHTM